MSDCNCDPFTGPGMAAACRESATKGRSVRGRYARNPQRCRCTCHEGTYVPPIQTVTQALAAVADILVPVYGDEVRFGATEYRQGNGGIVEMGISLHVGPVCKILRAHSQYEAATWEAAIDKLRSTHADVISAMRAEVAAKLVDPRGVR